MGHASVNVMAAQPIGYAEYSSGTGANTGYEAGAVVKPGLGTVIMVKGYNSGPDQWIQLHDAAAEPADASDSDGAVPRNILFAPGGDNFYFVIPVGGMKPFTTGIYICNSTTPTVKTIGGEDCWFEVTYL